MLGSPEASVVIPILNGEATLERQVEAVRAQLPSDAELVLVDNGSTDATADLITRLASSDPRIRGVYCPDRGVNRARNAGVMAARSNRILMCDADDEVHPGWVDAMRSALEAADLVGGIPEAVDLSGRPIPELSPFRFELWGMTSPWGCCCAFRKELWEQIGGFDERMSGWFDELDFFLRGQLAGASLAWSEDAVVTYTWRISDRDRLRKQREQQYHSCRVYWRGRMQGRPRRGRVLRDLGHLVVRAPLAVVSVTRRRAWCLVALRRWARIRGFVRFGVPEIVGARVLRR